MNKLKSFKIYDLVKSQEGKGYLFALKNKLAHLEEQGQFNDYVEIDNALELLTWEEKSVLSSIDEIDLSDFGRNVKIVSQGLSTPPLDKITEQPIFVVNNKPQQIKRTIYLPSEVMKAYRNMNAAYQESHPGRTFMLESGYRHPIVQRYLIVFFLVGSYNYSLTEVFKRVLPPIYSQHCSPNVTALDLCNIDTEIDPEYKYTTAFALTPVYEWLKRHGKEFGFYESYPEGNSEGIVWEPWHWQYRP